jgi:hypothetical protein
MMNSSIPGRARILATLAVGVALLAAGCGGGKQAANASGSSGYQKEVAFAHCMRSRGVPDWPDPLPQGGFPRTGAAQNSPQFGSAQKACQHLLPPAQPLSTAQQQQLLAQGLRYARCMRSHGVADFPDPSVPKGGGLFFSAPPGSDSNTPQLQAAQKACHAGTPHSG